MADTDTDIPNGRVTTREFYEMQLKIRDDMNNGFAEVKQDIAGVKNTTSAMASQIDTACKLAEKNHDEITSIKRRSNVLDAGVLVISAAWTGIIALATGNK